MRINAPRWRFPAPDSLRRELARIAEGRLEKTGRPCPECAISCPCSDSKTCTCACSPLCEQAARQLSSDPERFPIESGIQPLVHALNRIAGFQTIWSCEGHEGADGRLYRLPAVWFYLDARISDEVRALPLLLSDYLSQLCGAGKLSCSWQLRIGSWSRHPVIAYALEPQNHPETPLSLPDLWHDVTALADGLAQGLRNAARQRTRLVDEDRSRER